MNRSKPVVVWDGFSGAFVKLYHSMAAACDELGISAYTLHKYIKSGAKHNRKYYSMYYKDDIELAAKEITFPIQQLENGTVINQFRNITEAAEWLDLGRNTISRHIKNGTLDKWGCSWKNLKKPL